VRLSAKQFHSPDAWLRLQGVLPPLPSLCVGVAYPPPHDWVLKFENQQILNESETQLHLEVPRRCTQFKDFVEILGKGYIAQKVASDIHCRRRLLRSAACRNRSGPSSSYNAYFKKRCRRDETLYRARLLLPAHKSSYAFYMRLHNPTETLAFTCFLKGCSNSGPVEGEISSLKHS
jgi:hypothetical protein